ncbi:MAG TPA: hypothetical protein PK789_01335, partial [Thermomonas sp.]|uniref:hypothetical protein n=1 Tax=Thermomonas sp. TaxID=1971895 RepID=UPI002C1E8CA9
AGHIAHRKIKLRHCDTQRIGHGHIPEISMSRAARMVRRSADKSASCLPSICIGTLVICAASITSRLPATTSTGISLATKGPASCGAIKGTTTRDWVASIKSFCTISQ